MPLPCRAKLPNGQPLTHNELRVGQELELYSRRFVITSCDAATRAFYSELGQPQQADFEAPQDQHELATKVGMHAHPCMHVSVHVRVRAHI